MECERETNLYLLYIFGKGVILPRNHTSTLDKWKDKLSDILDMLDAATEIKDMNDGHHKISNNRNQIRVD
jgi:hypothetical protein